MKDTQITVQKNAGMQSTGQMSFRTCQKIYKSHIKACPDLSLPSLFIIIPGILNIFGSTIKTEPLPLWSGRTGRRSRTVQNRPEPSRTVHSSGHNGPRIAWTSKLPVKVPNRAEWGSLSQRKEQLLFILGTRCLAACADRPGWTSTVHARWNGDLPSQPLHSALLFSPSDGADRRLSCPFPRPPVPSGRLSALIPALMSSPHPDTHLVSQWVQFVDGLELIS